MRLFVALNVPASERLRVHEAAGPLRDRGLPVRWVDPELYHLTLKFLGEVRPDHVERIDEVLARVARGTPPFDLNLSVFGAFPSVRRPRVLWVGVEPTPVLRCLKHDVEWALSGIGFERETRAFHPHLTLGRAGHESGAGAFRGLDEFLAGLAYAARVPVRSIELMRSQASRDGAAYSVLSSHPFAGEESMGSERRS